MIETPSLRNRMTALTIAVVAVIVVLLDLFVYASLADRLDDVLEQVLEARTQTALQVARSSTSPDDLANELTDAGVPAIVHVGDQSIATEPGQRVFDALPPSEEAAAGLQDSAMVVVDDDTTIEVLVSREGAQATLRRVLLLEIVGSAIAITIAVVVLQRVASLVTRPVDRIVEVADAIADGQTDLRLDPSDPDTEVGRMAAALDRVVSALDEALSTARREEERSRSFLADAAHQLRTPIAGLRASAETLLTTDDGDDHEELLHSIAREADRIGRLVNSLLTMARLDLTEPINREVVDLAALVATEVARQGPLAPELEFEWLPPSEPARINADATWVHAAVANLLDNARRHARTRVEVELETIMGGHVVRVGDDGPGVPSEHRDRIFERFVSLDNRGSGLGLPIARAVARAHEGSLELVADRFELFLPTTGSMPAGRRRPPAPRPVPSRSD